MHYAELRSFAAEMSVTVENDRRKSEASGAEDKCLRVALPSVISKPAYAAFDVHNRCRHSENHHLGTFLSMLDERGDFGAAH